MYSYIINEKWYGSHYGNFDTLDEVLNELKKISNSPEEFLLDRGLEFEIQ